MCVCVVCVCAHLRARVHIYLTVCFRLSMCLCTCVYALARTYLYDYWCQLLNLNWCISDDNLCNCFFFHSFVCSSICCFHFLFMLLCVYVRIRAHVCVYVYFCAVMSVGVDIYMCVYSRTHVQLFIFVVSIGVDSACVFVIAFGGKLCIYLLLILRLVFFPIGFFNGDKVLSVGGCNCNTTAFYIVFVSFALLFMWQSKYLFECLHLPIVSSFWFSSLLGFLKVIFPNFPSKHSLQFMLLGLYAADLFMISHLILVGMQISFWLHIYFDRAELFEYLSVFNNVLWLLKLSLKVVSVVHV